MILPQNHAINSHLLIYFILEAKKAQSTSLLIKSMADRICEEAVRFLKSQSSMSEHLANMYPLIFDLRVQYIQEFGLDYDKLKSDIDLIVNQYESDERLVFLVENIHFTLRCQEKVVESVLSHKNGSLQDENAQIVNLSYTKLLEELSSLDESIQTLVIHFIHSSLEIDIVLILTEIVFNKWVEVTESKIEELSRMASEAGQNYYAYGMLFFEQPKDTVEEQSTDTLIFDDDTIKAEKYLADLGIGDFLDAY